MTLHATLAALGAVLPAALLGAGVARAALPAALAGPAAQAAPAAEGTWDEGAAVWLHRIGAAGPWILLAVVVYLVVRAWARRGRYRATEVLGDADREAVHAAIRAAERRTVGEIVPVVVERSDPHPAAEWRAACAAAAVGSVLLVQQLPWSHPALLLLCQAALGAAGFGLARALPDIKRAFLFESRASAVAEEQALQEFHGQRLHATEGRTGVLLFVSLFERRVVVLADEGVAGRVDPGTWSHVDDLVLDGIVRGSLREGLVAALGACGEVLAEHAPLAAGDCNEVPDRLVVRRE